MKFDLKFSEKNQKLDLNFGQFQDLTDGGYERGYTEGYEKGRVDFYTPTQEKTVGIAENGTVEITPNDGYTLSKVTAVVNITNTNDEDIATSIVSRTITKYSDSAITSIGDNAFRTCDALTSVYAPKVTRVGAYSFMECRALTDVMLDSAKTIGMYAFSGCTMLESINLPLVAIVQTYMLRQCFNLSRAELPVCSKIMAYAFQNSTALDTLILRKTDGICSLANTTNTLTGTKIANGTGYIYVPDNLVEQYKAATNWSAYASQIRAIEDYPEICGG